MIISKAFRSSLLIFLISMLTTATGTLVDGIIVSRCLASAAIAALTIGAAFNMMIELLSGVIATGSLNQCSKAIGHGNLEKANRIFSLSCILGLSDDTIGFCREHGIDEGTAMYAGLCVEEIAASIAQKGFNDGKVHFIDIRIILKPEEVIIRMRDDCEQFDPRTLQHIFNPVDPYAHIGIRMVEKMAKELTYTNVLKLNNMIIKLDR